METQEKWRSEALSHSPPPVSLLHAAPSYPMGTPDCLMFVTAVQRTPHPAVLIWSNRGPTATLSRQSASCRLQGKRSLQVTSLLARQVTQDHLYIAQTNTAAATLHPLSTQCAFQKPRLHAFTQRCRFEASAEMSLDTVPLSMYK